MHSKNVALVLGLLAALCASACSKVTEDPSPGTRAPAAASRTAAAPQGRVIALRFAYGSEKKAWLQDAIATFNREQQAAGGALVIQVEGSPVGSGVAVTEIVEGHIQPHIWSPASDIYRPILQAAWTAKQSAVGGATNIVDDSKPLVLSPVVIAMWKPMAEALGWPDKPIGWSDILALSTHPKGWASMGHPEWGLFKLGHTHPEFSNSGLLSVLAEAYAATGETKGLAAAQLDAPATMDFLRQIESSIVHYGKSTGFFADKMLTRGPGYLSAAVLYENLVIDSYKRPEYQSRTFDLVAIYPKEGTFWIDNPLVILDAPWVSDDHEQAAAIFRDYLLSKPVQTRAMTEFGFRPTDPAIAITDPIGPAFGVDPKQPKTLLDTPAPQVIDHALAVWKQTKKTVDIVFVFDRSGSMKGEALKQAKQGARDFLEMLDERDRVSLVMFNHEVPTSIADPAALGAHRHALTSQIANTFADGGTALYDAVASAHAKLRAKAMADPKRIFALVVLTDGVDESSRIALADLQQRVTPSRDQASAVRLFTIAYGQGADRNILAAIAEAAGGASFSGDPATIRQVYRDLAAFF